MEENRYPYKDKKIFVINVLNQFVINSQRAINTPNDIQESIFILQIDLFNKYCNYDINLKNRKYKKLLKYMKTNDFGKYQSFCKYYC